MSADTINKILSTPLAELEQWEIPINNWKSLGTDTLLFIHEKAEKKLQSTNETYHSITGRGVTLLSIYMTIFGVILGFIVSKIGQQLTATDIGILLMALLCLLVTSYTFKLVYGLIIPRQFYDVGHPPNRFNYEAIGAIQDSVEQFKLTIYYQIENLQSQITANEQVNKMRFGLYKRALKWTAYSLVGSVLALLFLFLICR